MLGILSGGMEDTDESHFIVIVRELVTDFHFSLGIFSVFFELLSVSGTCICIDV